MNQPEQPQYCATCAFRQAAGLVTIVTPVGVQADLACLTCATEALAYYASQPSHAAWFTAN